MSFQNVSIVSLLWLILSVTSWAAPVEIETAPGVVLRGVPFKVKVKNTGLKPHTVTWSSNTLQAYRGQSTSVEINPGKSSELSLTTLGESDPKWDLSLSTEGESVSDEGRIVSGWWSLLPPVIAIGLALATRQVLIALLFGIFSGAVLLYNGVFAAFCKTLDTFLVESIHNEDHAFILLFTMSLGGMVSLVSASGGMQGMVEKMSRYATTPATTQLATWFMGIAIFFDDYANTLLVGQTMKPVTDKHNISREKLAYLVDSTAAPIASIALISTWIGYEMSLISDSFAELGITKNVYTVFIDSILHRYYAIFALVFVFAIALFHRDFGPMLKAERRALSGKLQADREDSKLDGLPEVTWGRSIWDAVIPVSVVLFGTIIGLFITGNESLIAKETFADGEMWKWLNSGASEDQTFTQRLGTLVSSGNSYKALLWSAAGSGIISAFISKIRYKVSLEKITEVYLKGVSHMMSACIVLVLAWAIGATCEALQTGPFLVELCRGILSSQLLPLITFLLASTVAFSTGSSWGTMAIVMPLAIRLSYELPKEGAGLPEDLASTIMIATIASVLAGATFGDHCSPISDTTIMSSMASGCNHIDHVRTQIPYALVTAALSIVLGTLPAAYGVNPWLLNVVGMVACVLVVRFVGKPVIADAGEPEADLAS